MAFLSTEVSYIESITSINTHRRAQLDVTSECTLAMLNDLFYSLSNHCLVVYGELDFNM